MYIDYLNIVRRPSELDYGYTRYMHLFKKTLELKRKDLLKYVFTYYCEEDNLEEVKILTPLIMKYFPEYLEMGLLKAIQEKRTRIVKYLLENNVEVSTPKIIEYVERKRARIKPEILQLLNI